MKLSRLFGLSGAQLKSLDDVPRLALDRLPALNPEPKPTPDEPRRRNQEEQDDAKG